jgi:hypothetical protein
MFKRPVREEVWVDLDDTGEPLPRALRLLLEALELVARPFPQMEVESAQTVVHGRFVEVTVVVDPTSDVGSIIQARSLRAVSVRFWRAHRRTGIGAD